MNFVKSNSFVKFRAAKQVFASQSGIKSRFISSSPPPLLQQSSNQISPRHLLTRFSIPIRHIYFYRNTKIGYDAKPPKNCGIVTVPEEKAYIIERFGKFVKTLNSGTHLLIPFVEKIAYVHSLVETVICIPEQNATTQDNFCIQIHAIANFKIVDPKLASYVVENPFEIVIKLAQRKMVIATGRIAFNKILEERDTLNQKIMGAINEEARDWGLKCVRYAIGTTSSPSYEVKKVMEKPPEGNETKRTEILASEGESEAIPGGAQTTAREIAMVSQALNENALVVESFLKIVELYIHAVCKTKMMGPTTLLPLKTHLPADTMTRVETMFKNLTNKSGVESHDQTGDGNLMETQIKIKKIKEENHERSYNLFRRFCA